MNEKNYEEINKINSNETIISNIEDNSKNSKIIINSKLDLSKIPLDKILHENILNFQGLYYKRLYEEAKKEEEKDFKDENELREDIIKPISIKNNYLNVNHIINNNDKKERQIQKEELNKNNYCGIQNEEKKENNKNDITKRKKINKKKSKSDNIIKENKHNNKLNDNFKNKLASKNLIFRINKIIFEIQYNTQMGENISVIGSNNKLGNWDTKNPLNLNWNKGNIWSGKFDYNEIKDFEYKFILQNNGYIKEWENGFNRKFIFHQIKSLIEPNLANGNIIKLRNIMNQTLEYNNNNFYLKIISEWNKK